MILSLVGRVHNRWISDSLACENGLACWFALESLAPRAQKMRLMGSYEGGLLRERVSDQACSKHYLIIHRGFQPLRIGIKAYIANVIIFDTL